jgi:hypothetical protein
LKTLRFLAPENAAFLIQGHPGATQNYILRYPQKPSRHPSRGHDADSSLIGLPSTSISPFATNDRNAEKVTKTSILIDGKNGRGAEVRRVGNEWLKRGRSGLSLRKSAYGVVVSVVLILFEPRIVF